MSDEHAVSKILIALFVLEIIGILLSALLGANVNIPALTQFSSFASNINSSANNLVGSFNTTICLITFKPACHTSFMFLQASTIPIASQLISLINLFIWILNLVISVLAIFVFLLEILALIIVLLGFMFIVLIPSFFINVGILGYILGLGYAFIIVFLGYKYGKEIIELIRSVIGTFTGA